MFHVFHLGPLILGKRRHWMVGAIDEFGPFEQPVLHRELHVAVQRMVQGLSGEDVTLEPALAALAPGLGVPVGPLPEYLEDAPAVLAFFAVNALDELPMGTGIPSFLETCRTFGSVAPWERFRANQPLLVRVVARNRTTTRQAVVTGGSGEPVSLALFDRPGDALRGLAALRSGDLDAASRYDAITLAFRPEPEWAIRTVRSAFDLPEFPFVFRTRRGEVRPATEAELGALTAALDAVASLASEPKASGEPLESTLCIDGHEFSAVAFPPGSSPPADSSKATPRGARQLPAPRPEDMN
jgi:hypothetical protein